MKSQPFTLAEDLYALSALAPTISVEQRVAQYLQVIETSSSLAHREKWMDQIAGYMHALEDLDLLTAEQWVLLRELVTRASLRSNLA